MRLTRMGGIFGSWQPSLRDVKRIVHVDAKLPETLISRTIIPDFVFLTLRYMF